MRNDSLVTDLLESAAGGVESAWQEIIRRYSPLVTSVCRGHRLSGADAEDVGGNVWLRLVTNLGTIRQPEALPGWLATTARRECLNLLREKRRQIPSDGEFVNDVNNTEPAADGSLLVNERRNAVRAAFEQLPDRDRKLLSLLFSDPPMPYTEISSSLGVPIGAIGPTRQRCLARVRRTPLIAALLVDECHVRSPQLSATARGIAEHIQSDVPSQMTA
jgi:RNA polymerase sigma factor (sigma-70 family)